jgi:hypothetical protein
MEPGLAGYSATEKKEEKPTQDGLAFLNRSYTIHENRAVKIAYFSFSCCSVAKIPSPRIVET